jgi:hypothetical protein
VTKFPEQESKHDQAGGLSSQRVHPLALIATSAYIALFLAIAVIAQQFPENWFVKKVVGEVGLFGVGFILLAVTVLLVSLVERRSKKRLDT